MCERIMEKEIIKKNNKNHCCFLALQFPSGVLCERFRFVNIFNTHVHVYMYIYTLLFLITLHILVFHVNKLHVLIISVCTFL